MRERWRQQIAFFAEVARFCAAGAANTVFTIGVYELFVAPLGPVVAYSVAWALGLVLVGVLYPQAVYHVKAGVGARLRLVLGYIVIFCIGLGLTALLQRVNVPARWIVLVVALVTATAGYVGGRLLLRAAGSRITGRA